MKIAFYFTHCETLGHTTRVFSLAESMKQCGHFDFFFLQAGKPLSTPPTFPYLDLPHPFYSKQVFYGRRTILSKEQTKERIKIMHQALYQYSPDIFFVEYFPFGREDCAQELLPILTWLRERRIPIYSIIGYPVISTNTDKVERYLSYFTKLFILAPREHDYVSLLAYLHEQRLSSTAQWYEQFFVKHHDLIHFVGYVLPSGVLHTPLRKQKREKNVLLSRGGGVIYPRVLTLGMQIAPYFSNYDFLCVGGPASSQKEHALFSLLAKKNHVHYVQSLPSLSSPISTSTASINMSGYGTVTQLFYFGTPSLLIPREKEKNLFYLEQRYRANMAEKLGYGVVASYEKLSVESMVGWLRQVLQKTPEPFPLSNFTAAEQISQVITCSHMT